jgi:hypothetical protein
MKAFTYVYQGQVHSASTDHYLIDGYKKYRISVDDGYCLIVQSDIPGEGGTTVWMQEIKTGDAIQPDDLIQSLGKGLQNAEVI